MNLVRWSDASRRSAFKSALNFGPHTGRVGSQVAQNTSCKARAFANQAKENVLRADVVVLQRNCFPERELEHLLRSRCESRGPIGGRGLAPSDSLHDRVPDLLTLDGQRRKRLHRDVISTAEHAQEQVLGPDEAMAEFRCLLLRAYDDAPGVLGEPGIASPVANATFDPLQQHGALSLPARALGGVDDLVDALVAEPEVLCDLTERASGGMQATKTVMELDTGQVGLVLELEKPRTRVLCETKSVFV